MVYGHIYFADICRTVSHLKFLAYLKSFSCLRCFAFLGYLLTRGKGNRAIFCRIYSMLFNGSKLKSQVLFFRSFLQIDMLLTGLLIGHGKKKSNFAGFSGANSRKKRPILQEFRENFRGQYRWKTIGKERPISRELAEQIFRWKAIGFALMKSECPEWMAFIKKFYLHPKFGSWSLLKLFSIICTQFHRGKPEEVFVKFLA